MKTIYKKILPFILSAEVLVLSLFSCSIPVYAADFMPTDIVAAVEYGVENGDWQPFYRFLYNSSDGIMYLVSQMGAVVNRDFQTWVDNNQKLESLTNIVPARKENNNIVFTKEFMTQLKALLDEYAKQHEPYTIYKTIPLNRISNISFGEQKNVYDSLKNLLADSPSGIIGISYYRLGGTFRFTDIGSHFKDVGFVKYYYNGYKYRAEVKAYDIETWNHATYPRYELVLGSEDSAIKNKEDFISRATTTYTSYSENIRFFCLADDANIENLYNDPNCLWTGNQVSNVLLSNDSRRIRVYNTYADFQDYTLGKRSVYYTSNYYDYVPEDLTVTIDDLQKTVDDLSKVIDELLDQISKDTDESEIEELLRQILEELRKNPGGNGGSGGSGGGDVTVNVDMTQTNSWLAQIYAKVSQIYDKMNSAVEAAEDAALAKIQESLDEIIEQLKKIRRWAAVDTVIDGVDAVADWLDLIRDVLTDGAGSAVAALSSALQDSTDLIKQKFPFSIPWDILFLVTVLSAEPETPQFSIPFNFEFPALDLSVDYEMELDFTPFQWLSDLSRLLLSMTYAAGLMKKTSDIVLTNKEG